MAERTTIEVSESVVSPSGTYDVSVTSTVSSEGSVSQVIVSSENGGSGLAALYAARVSMGFEWATDNKLIVRYPDDLPPPRIDATNSSFGFGGRGEVVYRAVPRDQIATLSWFPEVALVEVLERRQLKRGQLVAIQALGETTYAYSYYDAHEADSSVEVLMARGFQSGGCSWAGIIHGLVALRAPEILSEIHLNPEADGLSVESTNRAFLLCVADLVAEVKGDPVLMDEAIKRAQADGEME